MYVHRVPGVSAIGCASANATQSGDRVMLGKLFAPPNSVHAKPADIVSRWRSVIARLRASASCRSYGKNAEIGVSGSGSSPLSMAMQTSADSTLFVQE